MRKALVFYHRRENRYSFNALLGAVEEFLLEGPYRDSVFFPKNQVELLRLLQEIDASYKEVFLFISFFTTQFWEIRSLLEKLKNLRGPFRLIKVAGGPHASALPQETLLMGFDFVLIGEGEKTFLTFLRDYVQDGGELPDRGLAYWSEGRIVRTSKSEMVDLDQYPPFSLRLNKIGPLEITRGCPFLCKYCQTPRLFGAKVRHRSLEKIFFYAEALLKRGIRDLRFITPNAFSYGSPDGRELNLPHLTELLRGLSSLTRIHGGRIFFGTFPSEVRPEHVTEETLNLIKTYCANDSLVIGAQTGSERLLKVLQRGHTVEDVRRAVILTHKAGLKAKVDFIFGLPGETEEDLKESISFMEELASMGAVIHAHTFMPLPQTPFMYKPAGKVSKEIFEFIRKYLPKGQVFGLWEKQMSLAGEMEKLYKSHLRKRLLP